FWHSFRGVLPNLSSGITKWLFVWHPQYEGAAPMEMKGEAATWPLIDRLVERGSLLRVDRLFAQGACPFAEEAVALFACFLMAASRNGHLCVEIGETIDPPLIDIMGELDGDLLQLIEKALRDGANSLSLECEMSTTFGRLQRRFYLKRNLRAEEA